MRRIKTPFKGRNSFSTWTRKEPWKLPLKICLFYVGRSLLPLDDIDIKLSTAKNIKTVHVHDLGLVDIAGAKSGNIVMPTIRYMLRNIFLSLFSKFTDNKKVKDYNNEIIMCIATDYSETCNRLKKKCTIM